MEIGYAIDILAQVEMAREMLEDAGNHLRQAIEIHSNGTYRFNQAQSKYNLARLLIRLDQTNETIEMLHSSSLTFSELQLEYQVNKVSKLLEQITNTWIDTQKQRSISITTY